MEKEKTLVCKNGIEIHSYKNPLLHGFYISLFLRAGSMYEEVGELGMTHFLEHSLIRNVNSLMGGGLYPLLDEKGLEFNASTYSEMVQFYVSGASTNFSSGAELISKIISPLRISVSDFIAERERIRAEIRESDDRTSLSAFAGKIVYEDTSLSRPILGTLGDVSKITLLKLEKYREKVFSRENVFLYVTGSFTDGDIEYLKALVGKRNLREEKKRENIAPVPNGFCKREPLLHLKNADFTMLRFNFDMDMSRLTPGADDLLYDILLGGYNSRFFIEMSEKKGLFYDLTGAVEKYRNIGSFTFSYEVRGGSVYEALEMTLAILNDIKKIPLAESALMKAGYVDNGKLLYDESRDLNFTFAYDRHIMNLPYSSIEERAKYYKSITPEQIRSTASEIFKPENLTLTMKGNKKKIDKERIDKMLSEWK